FILMPRRPPRYSLFPYTTLFRSHRRSAAPPGRPRAGARGDPLALRPDRGDGGRCGDRCRPWPSSALRGAELVNPIDRVIGWVSRSEEHTSELQSRENLVCRLLLE